MGVEIVALLIPITAIIFGFLIAGLSMYFNMRRRAMMHEERKYAMKHGLPVPSIEIEEHKNPIIAHKNATLANRKAFVILLFLGIAFMFLATEGLDEDPSASFVGVALIMLSFAFLIISFFKYKLSPEEKKLLEKHKDYGQPLTPSKPEFIPDEEPEEEL